MMIDYEGNPRLKAQKDAFYTEVGSLIEALEYKIAALEALRFEHLCIGKLNEIEKLNSHGGSAWRSLKSRVRFICQLKEAMTRESEL